MICPKQYISKHNRLMAGFTLIEISITSALLAIVIGVASAFWYFIQQNYHFSVTRFQITDQANQTLRQITSEIRQAKAAMNGAYPLALLEDNQLIFYADINSDGEVERRRYFLDNNFVKRGIVEPSGDPPSYDLGSERVMIIVEGVDLTQLPLFTYYNGNWPGDQLNNPLSYWERPLETRLIKVRIPLVFSDAQGDHPYQIESTVQVRNLKNN
jgi:prepilin-type N-terminal cleavage/methylation domain-containing protein